MNLPTNKICTSHPVSVQEDLVFVVDLSHLEKPEDLRADDLGSWLCNGKKCVRCKVQDGQVLEVFYGSSIPSKNTYLLIRRYYKHATSGELLLKFMVKKFAHCKLLLLNNVIPIIICLCRPIWRSIKQSICTVFIYWRSSSHYFKASRNF